MAAERMKKVAGLLNCPVCYETYKKPKYLPCHHSYCEGCMEKLQTGPSIICPECRETSAVPAGGVKELPNNFFINRLLDEVDLKRKVEGEDEAKCDVCVKEGKAVALCLDCVTFLCEYCYEFHKNMKECRNHNITQLVELQSKKIQVDIHPKVKSMLCADHDLEMNFFCETCDQLVCHYCTTNEHNGHVHNSVKKMANKHRKEMEKMNEVVKEMINKLPKSRQKVVTAGEKITSQATEVDQQIDLYYDEIHRKLQQQREELKNKLRELLTKKKKALSLQLEQIDFTEAQLLSVKELSDAVKNGSDQEALFMKKQVGDDVKRLTISYSKVETEPVELPTMEFIPTKKYKETFPLFGRLFDEVVRLFDEVVIPGNCVVTDIPTQSLVGSKVDFTIITKSCNNELCFKGGSHIIVQAQSNREGDVVPVEVKDSNDGSYLASFVTKKIGEVKLSIIIEGGHIKGSPYTIMVERDYKSVNKPRKIVNNSGNMGSPVGIAFGKDGVWAVADCSYHCVYIFDSQGRLIRKFGQSGAENGHFQYPWGLSFDANNDLYVADYSNNRVQKFRVDGKYLLQFGHRGSRDGQLSGPSGVVVHDDNVFVADRNNCRVSVFHLNGQFNHIIGSGHLSSPYDVAVTANDRLLVADYNNHCIFRFTLDGTYVDKFGNGHLNNPAAVTIDLSGFILVGEDTNNRVSVFDKDGVFIHMFGSSGSAQGQFSNLYGIAVSSKSGAYVADYNNKRVQMF
ncbi:tripartite motif-containing protein 2-like [Dysidea avara]|uniref:tripartite motif-containing protein 2-like n=1 Tax=Dysidea avara TaxID=196820 RepID=UPI00332694B2